MRSILLFFLTCLLSCQAMAIGSGSIEVAPINTEVIQVFLAENGSEIFDVAIWVVDPKKMFGDEAEIAATLLFVDRNTAILHVELAATQNARLASLGITGRSGNGDRVRQLNDNKKSRAFTFSVSQKLINQAVVKIRDSSRRFPTRLYRVPLEKFIPVKTSPKRQP